MEQQTQRFTVEQSESGYAWVVMRDGQAFASFSWSSTPKENAITMATRFNAEEQSS